MKLIIEPEDVDKLVAEVGAGQAEADILRNRIDDTEWDYIAAYVLQGERRMLWQALVSAVVQHMDDVLAEDLGL